MLLAFVLAMFVGMPNTTRGEIAMAPKVVTIEHAGQRFRVFRADLRTHDVGVRYHGNDAAPIGTFARLRGALAGRFRLVFATNAGIFEPDGTPTGLLVQDGRELSPLNRREGDGNFYLKPNGVFQVSASGTAAVVDSEVADQAGVRHATQSGPLLVRRGVIHPAFRPASPNRRVRSGVGVAGPNEVVFVLSDGAVTFHELAILFRDELACPDALFLDGVISRFDVPASGDDPPAGALGAFITVTERAPPDGQPRVP